MSECSPIEVSKNTESEVKRKFPLNEVLALLTGITFKSGSSVTFGEALGNFLIASIPSWQKLELTFEDRHNILKFTVLNQHPELSKATGDGVSGDNYEQWLAEQAIQFGSELEFKPITAQFLLEELAKKI